MIYNTYIIVPTNEITDEMVNGSINKDTTIRYSLDGTKAILKYSSKFPTVAKGYQKYNHAEIIEVLKNSEWSEKPKI